MHDANSSKRPKGKMGGADIELDLINKLNDIEYDLKAGSLVSSPMACFLRRWLRKEIGSAASGFECVGDGSLTACPAPS
ncbi:hypothetical protein D3C85_1464410 [compost metagenome]